MPVGAHQAHQRFSDLRVRSILDVENPVKDSVNCQQHGRRAYKPVGDAYIHQPHHVAAAAEYRVPLCHPLDASARQKCQIVDSHRSALVFQHQLGEGGSKPAFGCQNQAPRIGDDLIRVVIRKNAYVFNLNVFRREDIPVRHDEVFAVADIADAGPSCQCCSAAEDPVRPDKEGKRKSEQRREGYCRGQNRGEEIEDIRRASLHGNSHDAQHQGGQKD